MRRQALLTLSLVLALSALTGCAPGSRQIGTSAGGPTGLLLVQDRPPAPPLRGTTLDGAPLDLATFRGRVVVLNFWASYCAPCRAEAKNLIAVADQTKGDDVAFVGVNIKDDLEPARRFDEIQGVPYPSIHDQKGELLLRFRTLVPQSPPTTLLIDRQGRIAGRFIRAVTETELLGPIQVLARES